MLNISFIPGFVNDILQENAKKPNLPPVTHPAVPVEDFSETDGTGGFRSAV